jgi:AraC-like DNA-binding protein
MRDILRLPAGCDGFVHRHRADGGLRHWHRHDEPELNLVLAGRAAYRLADRRYDLGRGSLVWLFPGQEHVLVEAGADFAMWVAVIRPAALRRVADGDPVLTAADPAFAGCRHLPPADAAFLDRLCGDLEGAQADDAARFNAGIGYLFLTAWQRHAAAAAITPATALHPAVARAAGLIAADPTADIAGVAAAAGLSRSRLSRLFAAQLGQAPAAWRTRTRIERFLALHARDPGRPIAELADEAGFGSYAQFHRAFTSFAGMGPARWLRRPGTR